MNTIRIGTRGSALARWQANYVSQRLQSKYPKINFQTVIIKTEGDRDQKTSLTKIGGQGVFTKAIEQTLIKEKIDVAVHSLKDLPSQMLPGLTLAAVPPRGPVEDVLITKKGERLEDLKKGALIASGSIRRRSQLLNLRPDVIITDLRGNIETRLQKLQSLNIDGIILARAALERLKIFDLQYYTFNIEEMLPAVGQGAIGLQIRVNDKEIHDLMKSINHPTSFQAVSAERAFLSGLDSGCQFPVAAYAQIPNKILVLKGFVGKIDGTEIYKSSLSGNADNAQEVGIKLANSFIKLGAKKLLSGNDE